MMARMRTHQRRTTVLRRFPFVALRGTPAKSEGSNSTVGADPTVSYLADLLADTREELNRVDSKAALLLAASGVIIGALLAGMIGGRWTPFDLNSDIEWIWWLGVASAALGVFSIAVAVYPRTSRRRAPQPAIPTYYGDVAAYKNIDSFRLAIEKAPAPRERLIDQTFVLSRIVQRKYMLIRRGLRLLLLAILACTAAIMINIPLGR